VRTRRNNSGYTTNNDFYWELTRDPAVAIDNVMLMARGRSSGAPEDFGDHIKICNITFRDFAPSEPYYSDNPFFSGPGINGLSTNRLSSSRL